MILFVDSFNHYGTVLDKWDFPFNGVIIDNAAIARTGTRCLQIIGGTEGPIKNLGPHQTLGNYSKLIQGAAMNFNGLTADPADVMWFRYTATFTSSQNIIVRLSLDGGISVYRGAGDGPETLLGSSASKPFVFSTLGSNVWNYMEVKCLFHATNGSVEVRFAPPGGPMAVILSLTGIKTCAASDAPFTNEVSPRAAAGITKDCYFADYYCLDWSTPPNDDYLGGVRIYHNMPVDNGTVQWIPLANQNWQEVNEVPPDGDTSYNSADTVGLSDQYQHVIGGVPVASNIFGVQHVMDLTLGSGSRAITSSVNGTPDPSSVYLSNGYSMYTWPYDVNPVSGLPWAVSAFPVFFGPEVTA